MAGVGGFEPTNDGVKVRCLTAWLHPNGKEYTRLALSLSSKLIGVDGGIRTHDPQSHNLVL